MALPTSTPTSSQPYLYGTFIGSRNETAGFIGEPDLRPGVDFTRLRGFLPKRTIGIDSGLSCSLGDTPLELKNFARSNSKKSPLSCSLPLNTSVQRQDSASSGENENSSASTTPQSLASDTDNFLAENETQFSILFAFIQQGLNAIHHQLDHSTDCIIVPLDHYANMSNAIRTGTNREELSRDDLEDSTHFCDKALIHVKSLWDCLKTNLTQLYSILDAYERAYPEDRHLVGKFKASKEQPYNILISQLEQCQNAVEDHKKYLEARLTTVSWDELMKPSHHRFVLFSFVHFVIFLLGMAALAWYAGYKDRYIGLFYLYRGPMLVTLYFYLYSLNLVGWATANIRYVDIFGFSSAAETPTPYVIFNIAGILSLLFTGFVSLLMFTVRIEYTEIEKSETENSEIPERILPLLLWIITAIVLLNPFKWLIRKGRWGVVKVMMRILLAPLYRVKFGDFWFADQLNSIVVILLDLEFMLCFYSYIWPLDKNEDGKECNKNTYVVRPVISCLPAFWRLMQCLRCYYDTRHYPHLINAGKYFTTFPVVILFALYALDRESLTEGLVDEIKENPYLPAWMVASFVHAAYTFIWDIYMDWGLLQSKNLLRPNLGYSWKSLYYVAIIEDLILRFAWSLKLSLGLHLQAQVNLFYTLLAALEIFRRFVWNFYRVEYEHIKITTTQLPSGEDEDNDKINDKKRLLSPHDTSTNMAA